MEMVVGSTIDAHNTRQNFREVLPFLHFIQIKLTNMKKSILNIGKALNKSEQQQINGGHGCSQSGRLCCFQLPNGQTLCEPGICNGTWCILY
jgi:hypothetical protein